MLHKSNPMKADDNVLIEILCARPNQYIEDLKGKYEELFESSKYNIQSVSCQTRSNRRRRIIRQIQMARRK